MSTAKFLQCGYAISHNLEAVVSALDELVRLVCTVVVDDSEADVILPVIRKARDNLALIVRHIDTAIANIERALVMVYRCTHNHGQWHMLPVHLKEFQKHSRRAHELWPHSREYLNDEILPELSGHFFSRSILAQAALWITQLTGSTHLFPRLQAWGQFPSFIGDICAAMDPIPDMLDKVETYAVDLGERLQSVASQSLHFRDEDTKRMEPVLTQMSDSWGRYFDLSHRKAYALEQLDRSDYHRIAVRLYR